MKYIRSSKQVEPTCVTYTQDTYKYRDIPMGVYMEMFIKFPERLFDMNPYLVLKYNNSWVLENKQGSVHMLEEAAFLLSSGYNGTNHLKNKKVLGISPDLAYVICEDWLCKHYESIYNKIRSRHSNYDTNITEYEIRSMFSELTKLENMKNLIKEMHS